MDTIKVIITGSTGMVGRGVLIECLESKRVAQVLVINRRPIDMQHPKLKEIIHSNMSDLSSIEHQLSGYDACFFCLGISSIGMKEEAYKKVTYDITASFADTLKKLNANLVFHYVSGAGTDSTEKGRIMWARVKGATENMVLNKGFRDAYAFRPGAIIPEKGVKSRTGWVNALLVVFKPLFPLMRRMKSVTTSSRIGQVMIDLVFESSAKKHLENTDINALSAR